MIRINGLPVIVLTDISPEGVARWLLQRELDTGNSRWRHAAGSLLSTRKVGAPEIDDTFLKADVRALVHEGAELDDAIKTVASRFKNSRAVVRRLRIKMAKNIVP